MKKRILWVLLLFVMTLSFVGCAVGKKISRDEFKITDDLKQKAEELKNKCESGTAGEEDIIKIRFYHTMGQNLKPVLEKYVEKFEQEYPYIKVQEEALGGYDDVRDQINKEICEDLQPNLAYCYPDHVAMYNLTKLVVSLDDLIADPDYGLTQEQQEDFIEAYYQEGKQFGDGKMYTLPFSKSTEVLYYNKNFFEEQKLEVPDHWFAKDKNDTTSMEYVCEKIKEKDPKSVPLGYDSEANWFITMTEQYGSPYTSAEKGNHYQFDNSVNKEFVKKFSEWYQKGWVTTKGLCGAYTSSLFVNMDPTKPKSYMSIGSSAGATHQRPEKIKIGEKEEYPFEVGIARIPQVNPEKPKVISQGPSICIFNDKDPKKTFAAWLLLRYLVTSTAFQAEFSIASGYMPVLKSVMENEIFKGKMEKADGGDNIPFLSVKCSMEQKDAYYTSPAFNGSSKARDEVGNIIAGALAIKGEKIDEEIDELFKKAIEECEYWDRGD